MDSPQISHCIILLQLDYYHYYYYYYYYHHHHHHHHHHHVCHLLLILSLFNVISFLYVCRWKICILSATFFPLQFLVISTHLDTLQYIYIYIYIWVPVSFSVRTLYYMGSVYGKHDVDRVTHKSSGTLFWSNAFTRRRCTVHAICAANQKF